ncbi:MAG: hypothetical protein HY401_01620 [Elusimicrobia bacterium]|nr:hypothetical protein [Elusimicrobiota bacterium]
MKNKLKINVLFVTVILGASALSAEPTPPFWTIQDYVRAFLEAKPIEFVSDNTEGFGESRSRGSLPCGSPLGTAWTIRTPQQAAAYLANRLTDAQTGRIYMPLAKAEPGDAKELPRLNRALAGIFQNNRDLIPILMGNEQIAQLSLKLDEKNPEIGHLKIREGRLTSSFNFSVRPNRVILTEFSQDLWKRKGVYDYWIQLENSLQQPAQRIRFSIAAYVGDGSGFDMAQSLDASIKAAFRPFAEQPGRVARVALRFLRGVR